MRAGVGASPPLVVAGRRYPIPATSRGARCATMGSGSPEPGRSPACRSLASHGHAHGTRCTGHQSRNLPGRVASPGPVSHRIGTPLTVRSPSTRRRPHRSNMATGAGPGESRRRHTVRTRAVHRVAALVGRRAGTGIRQSRSHLVTCRVRTLARGACGRRSAPRCVTRCESSGAGSALGRIYHGTAIGAPTRRPVPVVLWRPVAPCGALARRAGRRGATGDHGAPLERLTAPGGNAVPHAIPAPIPVPPEHSGTFVPAHRHQTRYRRLTTD